MSERVFRDPGSRGLGVEPLYVPEEQLLQESS